MRAYMSHPIRGIKGKDATREDMEANNLRAIQFGNEIKRECPALDLYVPADHDEFVTQAFLYGRITDIQILATDIELLAIRDFLIAFVPEGHISSGMKAEIEAAQGFGMPVIYTSGDITPIQRILEGFKR